MKNRVVRLRDVASLNISNRRQNEKKIAYLDTGNIIENRVIKIQYFDYLDNIPSRAKRKVKEEDTIFSMVRPNQKHFGYINRSMENLIVSTGFSVVTPNKNKINSRYLFYLLTNNEVINIFQKLAEGCVSTYPTLSLRDLLDFEFKLPSLKEQKRIADILTALDDKIELNNQMNQTLEEIANLLYKRWFVDFEFPDDKGNPYKSSGGEMVDSELGMIPKGWEVKELGELVSICNGYSYRGTDLMKSESAMITIKNFDRNGGFKKNGFKEINLSQKLKEDHFAYRGDLFIAHTDLTQNADIIGNPIILMTSLNYEKIIYSMDVVKIKSMKNDFGNAFLKQIFYNKRFKKHALSYTSGTTVLHLSKKAIKNYRISIPNVVQKSTIDIFEKILRKQMILIEENIVLENTGQYLSKKIILKNMKR